MSVNALNYFSLLADVVTVFHTGESARSQGHVLRANSQAILVGSRTAIVDKPLLTVRGVPGAVVNNIIPLFVHFLTTNCSLQNKPLRVIVDTKGAVLEGPLLDVSQAPTLISFLKCTPSKVFRKSDCFFL